MENKVLQVTVVYSLVRRLRGRFHSSALLVRRLSKSKHISATETRRFLFQRNNHRQTDKNEPSTVLKKHRRIKKKNVSAEKNEANRTLENPKETQNKRLCGVRVLVYRRNVSAAALASSPAASAAESLLRAGLVTHLPLRLVFLTPGQVPVLESDCE